MTPTRVLAGVSGVSPVREHVAGEDEPAIAAWRPEPAISYGPQDRVIEDHPGVRSIAEERGYVLRERPMGGRPVVLGSGTLSFVWAAPTDGRSIPERYACVRDRVRTALEAVGIAPTPGETRETFCPGTYGLYAGGKVAGFAQRVRADVAAVGGIVIVHDRVALAAVLEPVYAAIDRPFDPATVGSVAAAGGPADVDRVRRAILDAFADRTI